MCSVVGTALACGRTEIRSAGNIPAAPANQNANNLAKTAPAWPDSLDAVVAAPENHKVLLENDNVRVLDVTVRPGEKEPLHGHRWPSVLYVTSEDDIKDYDADGKIIYETKTDPNPMKVPYTIYMEPQAPHAVENLSKKPLRLLRVELKQSQ